MQTLKPRYDVIVVGGRAAGGATAMLLARRGLKVLVVEQGARGADTLSTLALMRGGVVQLSRWGVLDAIRSSGTPRISTTTFHYADEAVALQIKPRDGADGLYAPRRTVLDPLLAGMAAAQGADIAYRHRLVDLTRDPHGRVDGVVIVGEDRVALTVGAELVIGADGYHSAVARHVGARPYVTGRHATSVIYTLVRGLSNDGYHWHFVDGAAAGQIPTTGGDVLVFVSIPRERFMRDLRHDLPGSFHAVLKAVSPALAVSVAPDACGPFRGFAGYAGIMRQAWGRGWALVGDAGYYKDPLTAHGITDALRDAELLARAVDRGTDEAFAGYQAQRDDLSMRLFQITDAVASFAWHLPELQALHTEMSEEMSREARFLRDLDAAPAA